jgi:hypothetical protein
MKVDPYRCGRTMRRTQNEDGSWIDKSKFSANYPPPDATAVAHESLAGIGWRALQRLPKSLEHWEINKHRRTIKSEIDRPLSTQQGKASPRRGQNPLLVHSSVLERIKADEVVTITKERSIKIYSKEKYRPANLLESIPNIENLEFPDDIVELTQPNTEL